MAKPEKLLLTLSPVLKVTLRMQAAVMDDCNNVIIVVMLMSTGSNVERFESSSSKAALIRA